MKLSKYLGIVLSAFLIALLAYYDYMIFQIYQTDTQLLPEYVYSIFIQDEINNLLTYSTLIITLLCLFQIQYQLQKIQRFKFILIIGASLILFSITHIWMLSDIDIDNATTFYTYPIWMIFPINLLLMMYALSSLIQFIKTDLSEQSNDFTEVLDDTEMN